MGAQKHKQGLSQHARWMGEPNKALARCNRVEIKENRWFLIKTVITGLATNSAGLGDCVTSPSALILVKLEDTGWTP